MGLQGICGTQKILGIKSLTCKCRGLHSTQVSYTRQGSPCHRRSRSFNMSLTDYTVPHPSVHWGCCGCFYGLINFSFSHFPRINICLLLYFHTQLPLALSSWSKHTLYSLLSKKKYFHPATSSLFSMSVASVPLPLRYSSSFFFHYPSVPIPH